MGLKKKKQKNIRKNTKKQVNKKKQNKVEDTEANSNEVDLTDSEVQYDDEGNVIPPSTPTVWDLISPDGFPLIHKTMVL